MPTKISPLDPSSAYVMCPVCRQNGNSNSPLQRDGHIIKCGLGHQITGQQLQSTGADMIKAGEIFHETPFLTDIKWPIWVHPTVKEKIERKFEGRVIVTVATLLAALADGSLVMITGEQAQKLKSFGINSGADMVASVEAMKETERQRNDAVQQLDKFQAILKAVGVA